MSHEPREPVASTLEPVPDSTDLLGQEHQRRRKRLVVGFAVAGVALVVGSAAALILQDRAAKARLRAGTADLSACLFGEALAAGTRVSPRWRASQLGAMGLPDAERGVFDGQPWPQRCGGVAQSVMEAAKDAGLADKSDDHDLVDRADALAKALKAPTSQWLDLSAPIDETWSALARANVAVEASKRMPGPPPPAKAIAASELGEGSALSTKPFAFDAVGLSAYRGEVFHILVQDAAVPRAPFVCAFEDGPIRCRSIPGDLGKGQLELAIFGTAEKGAWPLVLAGERGQGGLYRTEDGAKIADGPLLGASIARDGTTRVLRQKGDGVVSEITAPGVPKAKITREALPRGCRAVAVSQLWDEAIVECVVASPPPAGVTARAGELLLLPLGREVPGFEKADVVAADGEPTPEADVVAPIEAGHPEVCRSGDTRVAGVGGTLFFKGALGWSKPQKPRLRGGVISCTDKVAAVTSLADARGDTPWRASLTHTRCTVAECTATNVEFESLLRGGLEGAPRGKLFDATAAGDAMLVTWASGETGGVRLRTGAADTIVLAPDVVVYDDVATEGPTAGKPDLVGLVALGQPRQATLLVRTSRGVHAMRVAPDGGFAPAEVIWEGAR